jgi:hypothetical protein
MDISGHKTADVFRRYDIQDERDLAEVAAALDRKREREKSQLRHNPGPEAGEPSQGEHRKSLKIQ